jgi:ABC-2 type transport system permease protein
MNKLQSQTISLYHHTAVEVKLFWRSRQTVYLTFLIPLMGMVLLVYLNQEGMLERFFATLVRGMGGGSVEGLETPAMTFWTVGLIVYCVIDAAFESAAPKLVLQRNEGLLKRLGGTPLRGWVFLAAKTLNALILIFVQVALILALGLVSADLSVAGNWWELGVILLLGALTVAALGWTLSGLVEDAGGAVAAVHAIYIPLLLLCGAFVPLEAMPRVLQTVARALPLTYFIRPLHSVMTEGTGLAANSGDLLVLTAWMIGAWIVAVRTFRWE